MQIIDYCFIIFTSLGCLACLVAIIGQVLYYLDNTIFIHYKNEVIKKRHFRSIWIADKETLKREIKDLKQEVFKLKAELRNCHKCPFRYDSTSNKKEM